MTSAAVPSDLVLAAVRACSTSALRDRTIHRLLQGTRRRETVVGSAATRPARTASAA
jgi:energy-coupling factor transporter ATP-binding protein EcfA2